MSRPGLLMVSLALTGLASAAGDANGVTTAANRVEQLAGKLNPSVAMEFRVLAAQALQPRYPVLARKFVDATLADLRTRKGMVVGFDVVRTLVDLAAPEAIATLPVVSPGNTGSLITALAQHHMESAVALYRQSLEHGGAPLSAAASLLSRVAKEKPEDAGKLFRDTVAAVSFEPLDPSNAWDLVGLSAVAARFDAEDAASLLERVLTVVSSADYNQKARHTLTATFQTGAGNVDTANSRDTLLLAAGARLYALSPERAGKFKSVLGAWDFSKPVAVRAFRGGTPPAATPDRVSKVAAIRQGLSQFRGKPTDADRARLAIDLAGQIRELPAGPEQLGLAGSLCNLSTEGDLGKEALTAVSATLVHAIRANSADAGAYMELAALVRFEHVPVPQSMPAWEAADAVLDLRERLVQENGFTLTSMDGKTYSLDSLRGRVVLLNFWATWCPPCRKEMPDMETLYRRFRQKGLTILAVSDEPRETVSGFLEKQSYSFPVLLDPERSVHTAFNVDGIPKSFLFDREGKLVSQAIDMRTERQFLEMLKMAGVE